MSATPLLFPFALPLLGALAFAAVGSPQATAPATPPATDPMPLVLPQSVDLRHKFQRWGLERRCQGPRGTCSVFTVTGALEYAVASKQRRGTRLSVEFLNWAGHKAVGRAVDGGFFSELWKGYETYGICPEEDWPYLPKFEADLQPNETTLQHAKTRQALGLRLHWIKEWDVKTGLTEAELSEIKRTLIHKWPVCGGFRWPKQAHWKQDVLQMCPPEDVFDGHSVLMVGYKDDANYPGGGAFIIRNSGGDGRDGYLPYEYVQAYMNDAAWIEVASEGRKASPTRVKEP